MSSKKPYQKPEAVKELEGLALERKKQKHPSFPYPPKSKYRDDRTNDLTRCVIDWINLKGYQAERVNSMGRLATIKGKQRWIKGTGTTGTADISATIKGRAVKIEIKCEATGDRYQSKKQKEYQKSIEQAGGVYLLVRNFTQFLEWYNRFEDGR